MKIKVTAQTTKEIEIPCPALFGYSTGETWRWYYLTEDKIISLEPNKIEIQPREAGVWELVAGWIHDKINNGGYTAYDLADPADFYSWSVRTINSIDAVIDSLTPAAE